MQFNDAASSFRPRPARALKEPQAFLVREKAPSSSSSAAASVPSARADHAAVRESYLKKIELQKRALAWTELLLEAEVTRADFKLACAHLTRTAYHQILHERHLSDLCSYPLCSNPPYKPYRVYPLPRSRITTSAAGERVVLNVTGNDHEGFCGPPCRRRAEWVARVDGAFGDGLWEDELGDEVRVGRWKLLEEIERDGEPAPDKQEDAQSVAAAPLLPAAPSPPPPPPPAPSTPVGDPSVSDLMASLRIVENPTPSLAPAPPQLSQPTSTSPSRASAPAPPATVVLPPLSPSATAAQIREHERRRRADAANSSLVPSDILGFADSLITAAPGAVGAGAEEEGAARLAEGQDEEDEDVSEEVQAWDLMEAAREAMHRR